MKHCSFCNKNYDDSWDICLDDRRPLIAGESRDPVKVKAPLIPKKISKYLTLNNMCISFIIFLVSAIMFFVNSRLYTDSLGNGFVLGLFWFIFIIPLGLVAAILCLVCAIKAIILREFQRIILYVFLLLFAVVLTLDGNRYAESFYRKINAVLVPLQSTDALLDSKNFYHWETARSELRSSRRTDLWQMLNDHSQTMKIHKLETIIRILDDPQDDKLIPYWKMVALRATQLDEFVDLYFSTAIERIAKCSSNDGVMALTKLEKEVPPKYARQTRKMLNLIFYKQNSDDRKILEEKKAHYHVVGESEGIASFHNKLNEPNPAWDLMRQGSDLYDEKKYDQAIIKLREALELYGGDEWMIRSQLAEAYESNGNYGLAIKQVEWKIAQNPRQDVIEELLAKKQHLEKLLSHDGGVPPHETL